MQNALFTLAAGSPADHVYNHYFLKNEEGYWIWSGNQGNLVLSLIILVLGGLFVASKVKTGEASEGTDRYVTKNKFAHMIEVICNDRLGKKIRVKCNEDDTIGDLKKLLAAQTGTRPEKLRIQKWYTVYKDHITLEDYEIHDGMGLELYYN